jgi:hypothetical protein
MPFGHLFDVAPSLIYGVESVTLVSVTEDCISFGITHVVDHTINGLGTQLLIHGSLIHHELKTANRIDSS